MAEGRLRMNGEPYTWEADEMAYWLRELPVDAGEVEREKLRVQFRLGEPDARAATPIPGSPPPPDA
jgi:hypothetical protein